MTWCVSKPAGKEQRVADVTVVDSNRLVGADATGLHRLSEQPLPIALESRNLGGRQFPTGRPFTAAGPEEMGRFHVKQPTPGKPGVGWLRVVGYEWWIPKTQNSPPKTHSSSSLPAGAVGAVAVKTT